MRQNWQDPSESFLKGFSIGEHIGDAYQKSQRRNLEDQRQSLVAQAMQKIRNPNATSEDYYNAMLVSDKDTSQKIQNVFSSRQKEHNEESLRTAAPVVFALKSGDTETAISLMDRAIQSSRSKGENEEADFLERTKEAAKIKPDAIGNMLAGIITLKPGGKEVLDNILALSKDKRAEIKSQLDIAKTGSDIDKNNNDINMSKQANKIALMQLDANKLKDKIDVETNELKKKAMEVDLEKKNKEIKNMDIDMKKKTIELAQGKTDIQTNIDGIHAAKGTIDRMLSKPVALQATTGNISGATPAIFPQTRDFRVLAKNVKHQLKLVNVSKLKGMGSLSNAEGDTLENAMGSLDLQSSPKQYMENLKTIKYYLDLAEQRSQGMLKVYGPDISEEKRPPAGNMPQTHIIKRFDNSVVE